MEQREPPRIFNAEARGREPNADGVDPPFRRFPHFNPPHHVRRLRPHGIAIFAIAALVVLVVVSYVVSWARQTGVTYVAVQPLYQLRFEDISLNPDPPAWYRGGRGEFLERVRLEGSLPATISTADVVLKPVHTALRRNAWVADVGQIRNLTNKIVVPLTYRNPVALAKFGKEDGPAVDAGGVLLDSNDIDVAAAAPLIYLWDFPRPIDPHFGLPWAWVNPRHNEPEPDPQVVSAARLAAFLRERLSAG